MRTPDRAITGPIAATTLLVAVTTGALASCALRPPASDEHRSSAPEAHPSLAITSTAAPTDVQALLPLTKADLTGAIGLAIRFAAAFGTYRYNQAPQAYLARLRPMVTPELYGVLARSAGTPSLRAQRVRDRAVTTAQATPHKIRALGPSSVILLVDLRQDTVTASGRRQPTQRLAVTALTTGSGGDGGGWAIHDIQPAHAGNEGDTDAGAP